MQPGPRHGGHVARGGRRGGGRPRWPHKHQGAGALHRPRPRQACAGGQRSTRPAPSPPGAPRLSYGCKVHSRISLSDIPESSACGSRLPRLSGHVPARLPHPHPPHTHTYTNTHHLLTPLIPSCPALCRAAAAWALAVREAPVQHLRLGQDEQHLGNRGLDNNLPGRWAAKSSRAAVRPYAGGMGWGGSRTCHARGNAELSACWCRCTWEHVAGMPSMGRALMPPASSCCYVPMNTAGML